MLSSRQKKKKTAETQEKDSSDGMKFTFRKTCFFIVSAWTFPCPHLSRKICLPLLKMLLVNWQKHWKWNLWSPESSVKELKQSQEWKRLQPRWDHTSLCSQVSCPPETSHWCCRDISPCSSPALPAESRGPHTCVRQCAPDSKKTWKDGRGLLLWCSAWRRQVRSGLEDAMCVPLRLFWLCPS